MSNYRQTPASAALVLLSFTASLQAGSSDPLAPAITPAIAEAVAHAARSETDRAIDENRRPDQVLAFLELGPGMTVLDLFSGGGYYAELLNHLVGSEGRVLAHSNEAYESFVGSEVVEARFGGGRLEQVERLVVEANDLALAPESLDAALLALTYHDIYYRPAQGWVHIDGPGLRAKLLAALKPGGTVGIIDHAAEPGAPASTGHSLHRIDPELVKQEMLDAGFEWVGEADFLRNPRDDVTQPVFSGGFRGRTDRFVQRYRKPD